MESSMRRRIKLAHGWEDWTVGPHGKSKHWRLFSPDGQSFTPEEVLELTPRLLDLDFWQVKAKELEQSLLALQARPDHQLLIQITLLMIQLTAAELPAGFGDLVIRRFGTAGGLLPGRYQDQIPVN